MEKKSLGGSRVIRSFAFFLLMVCSLVALAGLLGTGFNVCMGGYTRNPGEIIREMIEEGAENDSQYLIRLIMDNTRYAADVPMRAVVENTNLSFELLDQNGQRYWTFGSWDEDDYCFETGGISALGSYRNQLTMRLYVDNTFPATDYYSEVYFWTDLLLDLKFIFIFVLLGGAIVSLGLLGFLVRSAGLENGREGIRPSLLTWVPYDLYTGSFLILMAGCLLILPDGLELIEEHFTWIGLLIAVIVLFLLAEWLVVHWLMETSIRVKQKSLFRNTVIYRAFHFCWKILAGIWNGMGQIVKSLPLIPLTGGLTGVVCGLELLGIFILHREPGILLIVWFMEKLVLVPLVLFLALQCSRLQQAGRELAKGNLEYKVDTGKMLPAVKEHGENLNSIGKGMSAAVSERMKSEHLKTELITNVSHDLKTPLTSIINYADLLGAGNLTGEQIQEYSEVLYRQSVRLKKLLEDLLEASKATTGNLEVHMEICQPGVLLQQAAGEYEQRMQEKGLKMVLRIPEEDILIRADGRHLWRVFDNLLGNICKYSQENTRVYLSLEEREKEAVLTFRNTSKYELEVSAEELMERFVRGDRSRNMEGNGLGLSIAKSLVELQNGNMEIVTDGDLFKVVLSFEMEQEGKPAAREQKTGESQQPDYE